MSTSLALGVELLLYTWEAFMRNRFKDKLFQVKLKQLVFSLFLELKVVRNK